MINIHIGIILILITIVVFLVYLIQSLLEINDEKEINIRIYKARCEVFNENKKYYNNIIQDDCNTINQLRMRIDDLENRRW